MPDQHAIIGGVAHETSLFLGRRLRKLREKISGVLNVNPYLLRSIKDLHHVRDQLSLCQYTLVWHLAGGHATAFGKMIDEKVLPTVFGTVRLDSSCRDRRPFSLKMFDNIDHFVDRPDGRHLLSLKAGAWTIQHGQAMQMYQQFADLETLTLLVGGAAAG